MAKTLIWISFSLLGFLLALLPKPKIVFAILGICAVGAAAYILATFDGGPQDVLVGLALIGGPLAAGLVCAGALAGLGVRNLAVRGKRPHAVLLFATVAGVATLIVFNSSQQEQSSTNEKQLAIEFVRQHPDVVQKVGTTSTVSLSMSNTKNGKVVSYDFSVRGINTLYVVVDVTKHGEHPLFTLACMSLLGMNQRDPYSQPCRP